MRAAGRLAGTVALLLTLVVAGRAESADLERANGVRAEHVGLMARRGWSRAEVVRTNAREGVQRERTLAIGPRGDAIVVWVEALPSASAGLQEAVRAAVRPATGGWLSPLTLSPDGSSPEAAFNAKGEAIVAWEARSKVGSGDEVPSPTPAGDEVSLRTPTGAWLPPQHVQAGPGSEPHVAMDARGDVVLISPSEEGLYGAVRPAGGTFSQGQMISAHENIGFGPLLAGNTRGDAFVTWTSSSSGRCLERAAFRPSHGTWSTPNTFAECHRGQRLAIDARGDALVVWANQTLKGSYIEAAERSDAGNWTPAHVIARSPNLYEYPEVGIDARGDTIVVWAAEGSTAPSPTLWVESHPAGHDWEAPRPIPDTKGGGPLFAPPSLAVDARGDALVAWQNERGIEVTARAAGRRWQERQMIAGHEPGHIATEEAPLAQLDQRGDGVVSWPSYNGIYTRWRALLFP
jgi:hypothetical protein